MGDERKKMMLQITLILLLFRCISGSRACVANSIVSSSYRIFSRGEIRCSAGSMTDDLCEMIFLWPTEVSCLRPDSKMPSGWNWNSPADAYAHSIWRCETDKTWVQYAWMSCPHNATACDTSAIEDCYASFDPAMSFYYILLVCIVCCMIFGCMCCAGVCGYVAHCTLSSPQKSRRISHWV